MGCMEGGVSHQFSSCVSLACSGGRNRLFIQHSKPPMSAGFWAKGDSKDAEESPGGHIISSVVSNECVY